MPSSPSTRLGDGFPTGQSKINRMSGVRGWRLKKCSALSIVYMVGF